VAAVLAAAVGLGVGGPGTGMVAAVAQTTSTAPLGDQIRSARQAASDASADEARLLSQIDASEGAKRDLDALVASLDSQVAASQQAVDAAQARLAAQMVTEQSLEARLSWVAGALGTARAELARQAIAAYTGQTEATQFLDAALRSRDMGELVAKRGYIKAVAGSQRETVVTTERLRNQVRDVRDQATMVRRAAQASRDTVAGAQARLQSERDAQASASAALANQIASGNALRDQALARKVEFEAKANALQAQSDAIAASLRARAAAAAPAPAGQSKAKPAARAAGGAGVAAPRGGKLAMPVPGATVTSPFGYRVHPVFGTVRLHTGVDLAISEGTPIHAAEAGTVVSAGWMGGYGLATVIDHGYGLATLYAHQSSIGVSVGQQVSRGQVIGAVGCTGDCTGPHLHFEVRVDGTPVDPMPYL